MFNKTKKYVLSCLAVSCLTATAQTLIWSEEFNYTSAPDSDVWSYDLGDWGWGNAELQDYTSSTNNVWVDGSHLVITARRSDDYFSSGRIKTLDKLTFKYGTVEARIKTPDLGNGLWPAFWTLGNNFPGVGWPECGEIDVMEMGKSVAIAAGVVNRQVGSHAHWGSLPNHPNYGLSKDYATNIDGTFVTYRMEWTPSSISTYINDQWIWTMDIDDPYIAEFHKPHFFILNLAVGGVYTGITSPDGITAPFAAEYKVDWIRIYDNGHTVLGGSSTVEPPTPGTNLLENPGFESGLDGWTTVLSGGSASASTAQAKSGSRSLLINNTWASAYGSPQAVQSFDAAAGDVFNFQGYMLTPSSITDGSFGLLKIVFRDSSGNELLPASADVGSINTSYPGVESEIFLNGSSSVNQWIWTEAQGEAPANTAQVLFFLLNVNPAGSATTMYFDDISATLVGDPVLPFALSASVEGADFQISFPTQEGISYQLAYKSSMTNESWAPVGEIIVGDGNTNSVSYPASSPAGFYIVLVP